MNETSAPTPTLWFWMIVSTLTFASARAVKIWAATPGRFSTPETVTLASSLRWAMPETIAFSMSGVSFVIQVPSSGRKEDRTCSGTSWRRANSTDRRARTFEPIAAISSISSWLTRGSLRAPASTRGSAVKTPVTSV